MANNESVPQSGPNMTVRGISPSLAVTLVTGSSFNAECSRLQLYATICWNPLADSFCSPLDSQPLPPLLGDIGLVKKLNC
jgi:hypothetical protein